MLAVPAFFSASRIELRQPTVVARVVLDGAMLAARHVIFTDLDGTLLDRDTYSWAAAGEALEEIERRRVPLVFVSSKTRAEVEVLRQELGNTHPFVTENGGGLFIPNGYFNQPMTGSSRAGHYHCFGLGKPYSEVVAAREEIAQAAGTEVAGFHDMSVREVAENTGMNPRQAELAREREFDEPFFFAGASEQAIAKFVELAGQRGFQVTRGGRFWHLFSGSDKGRAVRQLMGLYRKAMSGRVRSIGLGDSANDIPMLAAVDQAVLLPRADGELDAEAVAKLRSVTRAQLAGPAGWNDIVLHILRGR